MEVAIIAIVAALIWYWAWRSDKKRDERNTLRQEEYERELLSDEAVNKEQAEFESRLVNGVDLPSGVNGREAYIYWNLMRVWFARLISANHYNDAVRDKIKSDLLSYIKLLESYEGARFLGSETENKRKADTYWNEAGMDSQKISSLRMQWQPLLARKQLIN